MGSSDWLLLLISLPNKRPALVDARGRDCGLELPLADNRESVVFGGGAGEMSIGSQSGMKSRSFRGGELSETLDAKESSRSDERKSSISSWDWA